MYTQCSIIRILSIHTTAIPVKVVRQLLLLLLFQTVFVPAPGPAVAAAVVASAGPVAPDPATRTAPAHAAAVPPLVVAVVVAVVSAVAVIFFHHHFLPARAFKGLLISFSLLCWAHRATRPIFLHRYPGFFSFSQIPNFPSIPSFLYRRDPCI